ncbi:MAG: D-Ala-D-Ala carboxypeptidase family metallohydrolase [Spirulina sp.]
MTGIKPKTDTNQTFIRPGITFKFLGLFAIGLGLALGFAILLSPIKESANTETGEFLTLALAGTLGGLLCSFLVEEDKMLEFPSWARNGKGLKPGFLGDIFVGIAGAFIAYAFLEYTGFLKENSEGIAIFATGLVGGYGSEYIMKAALKRLIQLINNEELLEEINQVEDLQNLANRQIHQGLNPDELSELQTQLETVSLDPQIKEGIFDAARDARRLGSRVKAYEERINQTIPILESLVKSDPNDDRYHAQLACAYRDSVPPRLDEALYHFDEAIELRDPTAKNNWHYELDRLVALIRKASQKGETNGNSALSSQKILGDLLSIDRNYGLERIFLEFDRARIEPIKKCLEKNPDWLQQLSIGETLLARGATGFVPSSTHPTLTQPTTLASTHGLTPKPVTTTLPTSIQTDGVLTKLPTAQPIPLRTTIKPDRWDKALKKAFTITKGASSTTASQDRLRIVGVRASEKMAQTDWPEIEKYINCFYEAAVKYDVPPAIIAAICSRESRGGSILAAEGTGDRGRAFGLMQVDRRYWSQAGAGGDPGSQIHINQGTEIYADYRNQLKTQHPSWTDEYLLKGAAVAYNSGVKNVQTKSGMDRGTTGNDYGSDVIARAKFYATKLKSLAECKAKQTQGVRVHEAQPTVAKVLPTQTEIQKITALKDTLLKKQPMQSFQLPDDQKLAVAAGQSYDVEAYKDMGEGHYWVKLASNAEEWYIYDAETDGHWDTTWEGEESDTDTPVTPDQAMGEIHNTPGSIDWSNSSLRISKYFTAGEVTKKDYRRRPKPNSAEEKNILAMAKELDKIRADWGSSILINSWFRPSRKLGYPHDVNREQGGVSNSQHIYGRAVDIRPAKGSIYDFQKWLERSWYGYLGQGAKKGFVHLDRRNGRGWKTGGKKGGRFPY